jgi:hypothetical protein
VIGLRLAFGITLLSAFFSPVAAEAEQTAKIVRIGYLGFDRAGGIPASERHSSKDCAASVTSRVAIW